MKYIPPIPLSEESVKILLQGIQNSLTMHKGIRPGQTMFNQIESLNPRMADRIRGTNCDPFYDSSRILSCLKCITSEEIAGKYTHLFAKLI